MRVTMMLADHAQVADGKLFISGGGWSVCGPGPVACGVAVLFHIPWQHTNEKISFTLRLLDEDGTPVSQPGLGGGSRPGRASSRPGARLAWLPGLRSTCRSPSTRCFSCLREHGSTGYWRSTGRQMKDGGCLSLPRAQPSQVRSG